MGEWGWEDEERRQARVEQGSADTTRDWKYKETAVRV